MSERRNGSGASEVGAGGAAPLWVSAGAGGAEVGSSDDVAVEEVGRDAKSVESRGDRSQMRMSLSDEPVTRTLSWGMTVSAFTKSVWAIVVERCAFVCEKERAYARSAD